MENIQILLKNRTLFFVIFTLIYFIIEMKKPILEDRKYRYQVLQDFVFWFIIVDYFIYPSMLGSIGNQTRSFLEAHMWGVLELRTFFSIEKLSLLSQFLITFLVLEFLTYLIHRFLKHSKILWTLHKCHHNTKICNQFVDSKNNPLFVILEDSLIIIILTILSANHLSVAIVGFIRMLWGPFIHMNSNVKWIYPFSHIFTSPFTHRWHHSIQNERCNYSNFFIFFDVILGTFYNPDHYCKETGFKDEEIYPQLPSLSIIHPFEIWLSKIYNFFSNFKDQDQHKH